LCEMPCQKRNEGCQIYNHEEREASDTRHLSHMWDKDVQDREGLAGSIGIRIVREAGHL